MALRSVLFLMACIVAVVLVSPSFGDDRYASKDFRYWYEWLELCRPEVFAVVQPQVDALVEATPIDSDSDPGRRHFTQKYLQSSGVLDLAKSTPEWEDVRVRSTDRGSFDSFLRQEIALCKRENEKRQRQIALQEREAADRRERIRREMAAQAEREREAAKKVTACAEHAQYKASLKEGPGLDAPRFTMLDMEQWENWMRQNYPIRFAKYGKRMMLFIDCEMQAYEAEGREMDSVLELMENAGVFAFIVQTKEWSHYVDWIAAQQR